MVSSSWPRTLPRSIGPAGAIVATASDVIEFARLHLHQGRPADGTRVLSADSVAMMQQPQVMVPGNDPAAPRQVGLGWFLYEWGGQQALGHNGGTIGQAAFLRALPDAGGAVCLLTNGGDAHSLNQQLMTEIGQEMWQLQVPAPEELPGPPTELALAPVARGVFATKFPGTDRWTSVVFYQLPGGGRYVHAGRATPKCA